ncbi:hypothetical protein FRC04_007330 [Tulasnella sp. 424]|nr:hypothetical protein FRC04_007330 [Tulasnella sp. 424]
MAPLTLDPTQAHWLPSHSTPDYLEVAALAQPHVYQPNFAVSPPGLTKKARQDPCVAPGRQAARGVPADPLASKPPHEEEDIIEHRAGASTHPSIDGIRWKQ